MIIRLLSLACVAFTVGCAGGDGVVECQANDECPSDSECDAGRCVPVDAAGEGEGEGEGDAPAEGEGEGEGDVVSEGEGEGEGEGEDTPPPTCTLDDGTLSGDELKVLPGLPVRTIEARSDFEDLPVDVAGQTVDGTRTWDFTGALEGDADVSVVATFVDDEWFVDELEAEFGPQQNIGGTGEGIYVASLAPDTKAVFRRSDTELVIIAIASVEEDRTFITYDPPILVLQYPMQLGDVFESQSTGSGTFNFNPFYVSDDIYTTEVDAAGDVVTAAGTFPTLRLRVDQDVLVGFVNVTTIQYVWLTPCLGVVAHVDSGSGETEPDFTEAARVSRLGAPGNP